MHSLCIWRGAPNPLRGLRPGAAALPRRQPGHRLNTLTAVIVVLVISNFMVDVQLPLGVVAHEGSKLIAVANGLRLLR